MAHGKQKQSKRLIKELRAFSNERRAGRVTKRLAVERDKRTTRELELTSVGFYSHITN